MGHLIIFKSLLGLCFHISSIIFIAISSEIFPILPTASFFKFLCIDNLEGWPPAKMLSYKPGKSLYFNLIEDLYKNLNKIKKELLDLEGFDNLIEQKKNI